MDLKNYTPFIFVAGIDEAGCGPLAGPVTAASVVLPAGYRNRSITDSKQLSEKKRESLFAEIINVAIEFSIVSVGQARVDRLNIRNASRLAHRLAALRLYQKLIKRFGNRNLKVHFMLDGWLPLETEFSSETIIKGDQKILTISAASILAKVSRDRIMAVLDQRYPGYNFAGHKGYGTKAHLRAISEKGPSKVHRRTFGPVRDFCSIQQSFKGFSEERST